MNYKIIMRSHTFEGSGSNNLKAEELISNCKADGIAITDVLEYSNIKEKSETIFSGYKKAKEYAELNKLSIKIYAGFELHTSKGIYLIYGIDKNSLLTLMGLDEEHFLKHACDYGSVVAAVDNPPDKYILNPGTYINTYFERAITQTEGLKQLSGSFDKGGFTLFDSLPQNEYELTLEILNGNINNIFDE